MPPRRPPTSAPSLAPAAAHRDSPGARACLRAWPRLAARAGRAAARAEEPAPIWLRSDGSVLRIGDVVLKHAPTAFGRVVRAHRQAARCLREDPTNRAAPLLGFDAAEAVVMLGAVPGRTMRDLAGEGQDPTLLCALAGRWLRRFHDARPRSTGPFDARGPLRRVPATAAFLPETYAAARDGLVRAASALQCSAQVRAVLHGDLNAGNLLVSGDLAAAEAAAQAIVTGVDFGNLAAHPAMRDAGQLLADLHLAARGTPDGVMPAPWRDAFERSYGAGGPVLEFFVRQRLLLAWAGLPARRADMGPARSAQAARIEALFGV